MVGNLLKVGLCVVGSWLGICVIRALYLEWSNGYVQWSMPTEPLFQATPPPTPTWNAQPTPMAAAVDAALEQLVRAVGTGYLKHWSNQPRRID